MTFPGAKKLHTHAAIFNITERENGWTRALQPHEMFLSQRYATALYRYAGYPHVKKIIS